MCSGNASGLQGDYMAEHVTIDTVPTEILAAELLRRHDVGCFFGLKVLTECQTDTYNRLKGNPVVLLGLIELEKIRLSTGILTGLL